MTEVQQMMVSIPWKPLLHSHVILDTLCMEMNQQLVKHQNQAIGVNKHQHAKVIKMNREYFLHFLHN